MKRILLVSIILALLMGGCGKDENPPKTQSFPSLTAEEIIAKASPKLDSLSSFHFKLSQKGGGTPITFGLEMTGASGDIAPPDKLKMKIEAKWVGQFVETDLITVGMVTYMTNPLSGKWEILTEDFNAVTLFQPNAGIKAVMESATGLSMLDEENVSGVLCFHLKGMLVSEALDAIAAGHAAKGLTVNADIWIGIDDFLLRKLVLDGKVCEDENEGIIRILELSKFNEPVAIELPE